MHASRVAWSEALAETQRQELARQCLIEPRAFGVEDENNYEDNATIQNTASIEDYADNPALDPNNPIDNSGAGGQTEQDKNSATKKNRRSTISPAQMNFIRSTRSQIDAGTNEQFFQDWTRLTPTKPRYGPNAKKIKAEDYYLKPIAAWVPHVLFKGHVPCCPNCNSTESVVCSKAKWVENPLVMCGIGEHRYLDTVRHPCMKCNKTFRATDLDSMKNDPTGNARANFRIHLTSRCAIDEELYDYLTKRMAEPISRLEQHLREMTAQKYVSDIIDFLLKVKQGMAVVGNPSNDLSKMIMKDFISSGNTSGSATESAGTKALKTELRKLKLQVEGEKAQVEKPIDFKEILESKKKKKRDTYENVHLGPAKIEKLMSSGITTGQELVELFTKKRMDNENKLGALCSQLKGRNKEQTVQGWVEMVQSEIERRKENYNAITSRIEVIEGILETESEASSPEVSPESMQESLPEPLQTAPSQDSVAEPSLSPSLPLSPQDPSLQDPTPSQALPPVPMPDSGPSPPETEASDAEPTTLPMLSTMFDPSGYNMRFFSRHMIENVQRSYFQKRKEVMVQHMSQLGGTILSIDTTYKLPKRVYVTHDKQQFKPWEGMVAIRNECNEVIWFGMIAQGESVSHIEPHLRKLKERLDRLQGPNSAKATCVDNCCTVRNKLQEIFPGVPILLDIWHWMSRWKSILVDPSSAESSIFYSMLSRAIFVVSDAECDRVKQELTDRWKRIPSVKEILQESNATVPEPTLLEQNIRATITYMVRCDAQKIAAHVAQGGEEDHPPKLLLKNAQFVFKEMEEKLSHVRKGCISDPPGVSLHFKSADGKRTYTARGSSKSETLNNSLNRDFLRYSKLGLVRAETIMWSNIYEANIAANIARRGAATCHTSNIESLALANSLAESLGYELPFKDVTMPSGPPTTERFGFELRTFVDMNEDQGEGDVETTDNNTGEGAEQEAEAMSEAQQILTDTVLDRRIHQRETTMQAFTRLTEMAWVPFNDNGTQIAVEERRLFLEMKSSYSRHATPSARDGYNKFRDAWSAEASRRHEAKMKGDHNVIDIFAKSTKQLQDYHDHLVDQQTMALLLNPEERRQRNELRSALRNTRRSAPAPAQAMALPQAFPNYNPTCVPAGVPMVLNPAVSLAGVRSRPSEAGCAPFALPPPKRVCLPNVMRELPPPLDFRHICSVCGRVKSEHISRPFGSKCTFGTCGRCHHDRTSHIMAGKSMGLLCQSVSVESRQWEQNIHSLARYHQSRRR